MTVYKSHKSSKQCAICLEKLKKLFGKTYVTKCNHSFHLKCMKKWLYYENRNTCPLCNSKEQWKNPNTFLRISGY